MVVEEDAAAVVEAKAAIVAVGEVAEAVAPAEQILEEKDE